MISSAFLFALSLLSIEAQALSVRGLGLDRNHWQQDHSRIGEWKIDVDIETGELQVEHNCGLGCRRTYLNGKWNLAENTDALYIRDKLVSVNERWGERVRFLYTETVNGLRLSEIIRPQNEIFSVDYDSLGRVQRVNFPGAQFWELRWQMNGTRLQLRDQDGFRARVQKADGWYVVSQGAGEEKRYAEDFIKRPVLIDERGSRKRFETNAKSIGDVAVLSSDALMARKVLKFQKNNPNVILSSTKSRTVLGDKFGPLLSVFKNDQGVKAIEDALGGTWTFTRDNVGRIKSLTDRNGLQWNFEYSEHSRVAKVFAPTGDVLQFKRGLNGQVKELDLSFSSPIEIRYTAAGQPSLIGLQKPINLHYDHRGAVTVVRGPGIKKEVVWGTTGLPEKLLINESIWEAKYSNHRLAKLNDVGLQWANDRLIGFDGPDPLQFGYGVSGRVNQVQVADKVLRFNRDEQQRVSEIIQGQRRVVLNYGVLNLLTRRGDLSLKRDRRGWLQQARIFNHSWDWRRDAGGLIQQIIGPEKQRVGYEYNSNRMSRQRLPNSAHHGYQWQGNSLRILEHNTQGQVARDETLNSSDSCAFDRNIPSSFASSSAEFFKTDGAIATITLEDQEIALNYDVFGRVNQWCHFGGCQSVTYAPDGLLYSVEQSGDFPELMWYAPDADNQAFWQSLMSGALRQVPTPTPDLIYLNGESLEIQLSSGAGEDLIPEWSGLRFGSQQLTAPKIWSPGQPLSFFLFANDWLNKRLVSSLLIDQHFVEDRPQENFSLPWMEQKILGSPAAHLPLHLDPLEQWLVERIWRGLGDPSAEEVIAFMIRQEFSMGPELSWLLQDQLWWLDLDPQNTADLKKNQWTRLANYPNCE